MSKMKHKQLTRHQGTLLGQSSFFFGCLAVIGPMPPLSHLLALAQLILPGGGNQMLPYELYGNLLSWSPVYP